MPDVSLRPVIFLIAGIIWALAYQGNLGKGLASIISPKTLEVIGGGNAAQQSTSGDSGTTQTL